MSDGSDSGRPTVSALAPLICFISVLIVSSCTSPGEMPTLVQPIVTPSPIANNTTAASVPTQSPVRVSTATPTWTAEPSVTPSMTPSVTPTPGCQESGRVEQGRFPSSLAQPDLAYRIYLPPCYGNDNHVYPVLYMLPGNIHDDSIWDQLGLDEAAESGIQSGTLPPMLIVMPEGGSISNETSGGPYSYEAVIVNELLPFVKSKYCAWQDASGQAIGGLSRGGYWSLEIAFRNPDVFGSVGGHAAALIDTYAGPALDPKYTAQTSDLSAVRIYLGTGQSDWYLGPLQILHENLLTVGKEHLWVIQEGSHNNDYWSAHVGDYLDWYAESWLIDRDLLPVCEIGLSD